MRPRPRPSLRSILLDPGTKGPPEPAPHAGFRVRMLDWQDGTANAPYEEAQRSRLVWQAATPFGPYRITATRLPRRDGPETEAWYVHRPGARHLGPCKDADAARRLAQSDYAERILSALEPDGTTDRSQ